MRHLSLDFENNASNLQMGYGLLLAGILTLALMVAANMMLTQKIDIYLADAEQQADAVITPESSAQAEDAARKIAAHLTGPWGKLFRALDSTEEPNVALLSLKPDAQNRTLRIYAEARGFSSMLSYYDALLQNGTFDKVVLTEHEIQDKNPLLPVRFNITASWQ